MKATIAVLCLFVALAYASVAGGTWGHPIDDGPLDPKCQPPSPDCLGSSITAYTYNRTKGCLPFQVSEKCKTYFYATLDECRKKCLPPPGRQGARSI
uniref:Putative tick kunitz 72 n=1 Tax=Ixodes ricinus TaxID=34613 RepID=V5HG60_IXORI